MNAQACNTNYRDWGKWRIQGLLELQSTFKVRLSNLTCVKSKVKRAKTHSLLEHLSSLCEDSSLVPSAKGRKVTRDGAGGREKEKEEGKLHLQGRAPETHNPCACNHS